MPAERWEFRHKGYPSNADLMPLLKFYLFETPVRGVSNRGRDFGELGWSGAAFNTLKAQMLQQSQLTNARWQRVESSIELIDYLQDAHLFDNLTFENEYAYYVKGGLFKIEGLFYLMRNAFAHGSFIRRTVRGVAYYGFETNRDGNLRGRAILREETLRNWKSIVLNPERYLRSHR